MQWNGLDILFGIIFLFFVLRGFFRGFIGELFSVGSIVIGLAAGYFLSPSFAPVAEEILRIPGWGRVVSFLGVFIVTYVILKIVERVFKRFIESFHLQNMDKALGFFLGGAEGFFIIVLLLWFLHIQPLFKIQPYLEQSLLSRFLLPLLPRILPQVPKKWI
ncbi:MAG: CvpA family protein [Spirochaetales bacterium]